MTGWIYLESIIYTFGTNMHQRTLDFVELIEANPFTPLSVLIEDFYGGDLVFVLKSEKPIDREMILKILYQAGIEDVL